MPPVPSIRRPAFRLAFFFSPCYSKLFPSFLFFLSSGLFVKNKQTNKQTKETATQRVAVTKKSPFTRAALPNEGLHAYVPVVPSAILPLPPFPFPDRTHCQSQYLSTHTPTHPFSALPTPLQARSQHSYSCLSARFFRRTHPPLLTYKTHLKLPGPFPFLVLPLCVVASTQSFFRLVGTSGRNSMQAAKGPCLSATPTSWSHSYTTRRIGIQSHPLRSPCTQYPPKGTARCLCWPLLPFKK